MLQLQILREKPDEIISRLSVKNFKAEEYVKQILALDESRRETQKKLDALLAESNTIAREIGILFKSGRAAETEPLKTRSTAIKAETKILGDSLENIEKEIQEILVLLPNTPHVSVPLGHGAQDNECVYEHGEIPASDAHLKPHWDLINEYRLVDFELGNKISGTGFPVYTGKGAKLQRALVAFFLDKAIEAGYLEVLPPLLVNEASAFGTGQLPDKDGQMYHATIDNLYLIPTAEVPVTNLYRDTILSVEDLPVKHVAYSACFRREAGSYGKDVRGLNRLHEFEKVEIVQITSAEDSYKALEEMKEYVSSLVQALDLPYRIVRLCGGDMSFASALTYDFEVFSAGQQKWLEVSSVSNFETFQSNRMKLRVKDSFGKIRLAHTLNGSALALPRIVAALLENNQSPDGIVIPKALVPYTGFNIINK